MQNHAVAVIITMIITKTIIIRHLSLKGTFTLIYTYIVIALSSPPLDLITQFSLLTIFIISRSSSASVSREYGIIVDVKIKIDLRDIH